MSDTVDDERASCSVVVQVSSTSFPYDVFRTVMITSASLRVIKTRYYYETRHKRVVQRSDFQLTVEIIRARFLPVRFENILLKHIGRRQVTRYSCNVVLLGIFVPLMCLGGFSFRQSRTNTTDDLRRKRDSIGFIIAPNRNELPVGLSRTSRLPMRLARRWCGANGPNAFRSTLIIRAGGEKKYMNLTNNVNRVSDDG